MNKQITKIANELCRKNRKQSTKSESIFWNAVRNRKFNGLKFLRQHPIFFIHISKPSFFIADFYCHEYRLVIEIDGKNHEYQKDYDEGRTLIINQLGMKVFRIKNEDIDADINKTLVKIKGFIANDQSPPSLLKRRG